MKLQNSVALRAIWKHIHPQLPLEPRQAQRLQQLLSKSFRQHLGEEHSNGEVVKGGQPTDAHIKRILASPLLQALGDSALTDRIGPGETSVALLQTSLCPPVDIFEAQVSMGQATLKSATAMLVAYESQSSRLSESATSPAAQEVKKALEVVSSWLWSSGLEESMEFVHDNKFLSTFTPFLVRAGSDEVIWRWTDALNARQAHSDSLNERISSAKAMRRLLFVFCFGKGDMASSADNAVMALMEASRRLYGSSRLKSIIGPTLHHIPQWALRRSWSALQDKRYRTLTTDPNLWPMVSVRSKAAFALIAPKPDPISAWIYLVGLDHAQVETMSARTRRNMHELYTRTALLLRNQGEETKVKVLEEEVLPRLKLKSRLANPSTKESPLGSGSSKYQTSQLEDDIGFGLT